jgi:hypothetical protein
MNGTSIASSAALASPDPQWSVQGIGDFNGDNKADILWRNATSGSVVIWMMNGAAIASSTNPAAPTSDWTIAAVGDYNGDGTADIAWRNANGTVAIWLMTAGAVTGSGIPGNPSTAWQIVPQSPFTCPDSIECGILSVTNNVRANGSFGPGNPAPSATAGGPLSPLMWSVAAATVAQNYAAQCNYGHNGNRGPFGESIYASSGETFDGNAIVSSWASEAANYTYSTNTCAAGQDCGHYTQLVWRSTTAVGCGVAHCTVNSPFGASFPNWDYAVCDYAPAGNSPTQPY